MRRLRLALAAAVLVAVHLVALGADCIAPYYYSEQHRELAFRRPTPVRWVNSEGAFSWRPWVWGENADSGEAAAAAPVRWLVTGEPRKFGPWTFETRLFGVDEPATLFLLGTDDYGRDVFSRLIYGARISLFAGVLAGGLSALLGLALGMTAGFKGGVLDEVLMRSTELFLALPWLYLLFGVRAMMPLEFDTVQAFWVFVAIVGGIGWARPARLFRGAASVTRRQDYVLAARSMGATDLQLLWRHVLPQSAALFWTQFALLVPRFVLAEVTLSFLGLGVGEPVPSWGNMLKSLNSLQVLVSYEWMFAPAVALLIVVLCYEPLTNRLSRSVGSTIERG